MKYKTVLLPVVFLLANFSLVFAQAQATQPAIKILRNGDVLRMYKAGVKPGEMIAKIVTSHCNFDTFPPVLRELKTKGLPDTVIMAMVMVPYGPPATNLRAIPVAEPAPPTTRIQVPAGAVLQIEPASPVSSAVAREGDQIRFLVTRRVLVNGVEVIERGAVAKGHIIKSKPAKSWGRGGLLAWVLDSVVAADGTRIPIKLSDRLVGKSRSKAVVAAAVATGATVLPYSSPVGLIWALKKGEEAVLDQSRKSAALVSGNTEVAGLLPRNNKPIFHSTEQLKSAEQDKTNGLGPMNTSFRPTSVGKH